MTNIIFYNILDILYLGHQALLVNTIYVASPACSLQPLGISGQLQMWQSGDDTASCCNVKIPDHGGLLKAIALSILKDSVFFFSCVSVCIVCLSVSIYLYVWTANALFSAQFYLLSWFQHRPLSPPLPCTLPQTAYCRQPLSINPRVPHLLFLSVYLLHTLPLIN